MTEKKNTYFLRCDGCNDLKMYEHFFSKEEKHLSIYKL